MRVSTITVIEAARKAVFEEQTLEALTAYLRSIPFYMTQMNKQAKVQDIDKTIIVTCISGQGSAKQIGMLVSGIIPEAYKRTTRIRYMDMASAERARDYFWENGVTDRIIAVVGTVNLNIEGIPYISVDELLSGNGIPRLKTLLGVETSSEVEVRKTEYSEELVVNVLKGVLSFLDAEKIAELLIKVLIDVSESAGVEFEQDVKIRFYVHLACMAERLLRGEALPYKFLEEKRKAHAEQFLKMKEALAPLEMTWNLEIPQTEIAYLVEIINQAGGRTE